MVRGRIVAESGTPLIGVRVAEVRHPPLTGFTLSRRDDSGEYLT